MAIAHMLYPATLYDKDVLLGFVPCYHIYGEQTSEQLPSVANTAIGSVKLMQFAFSRGVPVVIMPKFNPVEFCRSVEKFKVTQSLIVPPVCLALIHHPGKHLAEIRIRLH